MSRKTKGERLLAKLNAIEAEELQLAEPDRLVPTKHGFTLFNAAGDVVYEYDTRGKPPLPTRDVARHKPLTRAERQKAKEQQKLDALQRELHELLRTGKGPVTGAERRLHQRIWQLARRLGLAKQK
jgi:hypothetical protein